MKFEAFAFLFSTLWLLNCEPVAIASIQEKKKLKSWAYVTRNSFFEADVASRLQSYDVLCIAAYRLNREGNMVEAPNFSTENENILYRSTSKKEIYPLVSLTNASAGIALFEPGKAQERAFRALSAILVQKQYDGLHIDFEHIPGRYVNRFYTFLKKLKALPAMSDKVLSIAAFPPLHKGYDTKFYDMQILGNVVDEVVYMNYDYHLHQPGPVTDLEWVQKNIEVALDHVEPGRVWMGIPGYGYEWNTGKAGRPRVISEKSGQNLCRKYKCKRDPSGMLRLERPFHIAYLMDTEMHQQMRTLARRYKLKGWALWRLGFEL